MNELVKKFHPDLEGFKEPPSRPPVGRRTLGAKLQQYMKDREESCCLGPFEGKNGAGAKKTVSP